MFGPYHLNSDSLVGRGGMGEVHRAYDTKKKRIVALKLLPVGLATDQSFQSRFRRESEVAARLREPHVIPIHDFGEIDGHLFIDMRLVDGVDLDTVLQRDGPLPPARAVHIVAQVASALDAAHDENLIHRDVKPSNVLISGSGPDEFAYLIDFGIARDLLGSATSGAMIGTWSYMAPERFLAPAAGDARIDVYALACLLYEVLAGQRPFPGLERQQVMYAHLETSPPRPSSARAGIPTGFDDIIARGMAKDPQHRYPSTGALAAAARSVIDLPDRAPDTLPAPTGYPRPLHLSSSLSAPASPIAEPATPASALDSARRYYLAPPDQRTSRITLVRAAGVALPALLVALLVAVLLNQAPTGIDTIALQDAPYGVAVTPDGTRALITYQGVDSVSVIDIAARQVLNTITVQDGPYDVAVTPDGARALITYEGSDSVSVIDIAAGQVLNTITVQRNRCGLAVTPDGTRALITYQGVDSVSVIDIATGQVLNTITLQDSPCGLAVTPDGTRALITNTGSDSVSVIDIATGQVLNTITVQNYPYGVAVTPDGTRAVVTSSGPSGGQGSVSVIDIAAGQVLNTITMQDRPDGPAVTPDGTRALVTHPLSNSVSVIDIATGQVLDTITVQDYPIGVAVTPDGSRALITNTGSDSVSVIDIELRTGTSGS